MKKSTTTTFVLLNPKLAGFSFNGYIDQDGETRFIVSHNDANGNPVYRRFKWPRGTRSFSIPNAQQDVIEFFRQSPFCEGSPIALAKPFFKEFNPEKDAELVIADETNRILAQAEALKLTGQKLSDVALLCGYNGTSEKLQRQKVLSYAKNSPVVFMELLNSKALDADVLFNRCVNANIITKKGFLYQFDEVHLGNSKEAVIKKIMDDKKLEKALIEVLEKQK